jgi:hypothetical protein
VLLIAILNFSDGRVNAALSLLIQLCETILVFWTNPHISRHTMLAESVGESLSRSH